MSGHGTEGRATAEGRARVLYNGGCPVCSWEIGHYRRRAEAAGAPLAFDDLDDEAARGGWGLDRDAAARRLHVRRGGEVLTGLDAFRAIWADLPGWGWLARLTGLPVLRPVLGLAYDRVGAPILYAMHRRRERR